MKQIIQDLKTGEVTLVELPIPSVGKGKVLIKVKKSLISLGTEKMMLEFGKGGWLSKAKQQPDKVKMVLDKVKTDGLLPTIDTVMNKLSTPIPLGYSNVGEVTAVGSGVVKFKVGDRVISNGNHAEVVCVPENLCALVPDNVTDEDAVFTVVSAIALQGVRLASPTLGESVVVLGLGLIGLITVQLLRANGCNVIGFDMDPSKVALAEKFGAQAFETVDPVEVEKIVLGLNNEVGVDSVIITASTKSNDPIDLAPKICRHRGKVVLVGVVGLEINRTEFFKKEIQFQVSCSYGPGRYDSNYEQGGMDYPIGFVRWTENRNFCAILDLLKSGHLNFTGLISKQESFLNAPSIYKGLSDLKNILGFVLDYPTEIEVQNYISLNSSRRETSHPCIGIIGAGGFTSGTLLPALCKTSARIKSISSSNGLSSHNLAEKFKIEVNTTDYNSILQDDEIDTVIISTPHNSHGELVLKSLENGKNVFVEKPLALSLNEIDKIKQFYENSEVENLPNLMVGFNRRFSPLSTNLEEMLKKNSGTKAIVYTVNSGHIPMEHWIQDREVGGQRLIGEGCHFVDYLRFLVDSEVKTYSIIFADMASRDTFSINLKFKDGSIGVIHYFSNGNKSYPKEKIEVFCNGSIYTLDNFKALTSINPKGIKSVKKLSKQDKGHSEEINQFISAIKSGKESPISLNEIFEVSRICIELDSMG